MSVSDCRPIKHASWRYAARFISDVHILHNQISLSANIFKLFTASADRYWAYHLLLCSCVTGVSGVRIVKSLSGKKLVRYA